MRVRRSVEEWRNFFSWGRGTLFVHGNFLSLRVKKESPAHSDLHAERDHSEQVLLSMAFNYNNIAPREVFVGTA